MNDQELAAEVVRTMRDYSEAWEGYEEEVFDLGDVFARWRGGNGFAFAQIQGEDVDGRLDAAIDTLEGGDRRFAWIVSPETVPTDLPDRLAARGFGRAANWDGLVLEDLNVSVPQNPDVTVEELNPGNLSEIVDIWMDAMPGLVDPEKEMARLQRYLEREPRESDILVGRIDGRVVTYTATRYEPNGTAYLRQGATLPNFQKRGIYTTVLAHRLARARAAGSTRVVVQAITTTSSPILQKYGFRRVCGLTAYGRPRPNAPTQENPS